MDAGTTGRRLTFPSKMRLRHAREFSAVYGAKVKKASGRLAVFTRPNGLPYCRLGLSVGRAVGGAVVRNRVKRLVREAFRLSRDDLPCSVRDDGSPGGYDIVVSARRGAGTGLEEVKRELVMLAWGAHRVWEKRAKSEGRRAKSEDGRHEGA